MFTHWQVSFFRNVNGPAGYGFTTAGPIYEQLQGKKGANPPVLLVKLPQAQFLKLTETFLATWLLVLFVQLQTSYHVLVVVFVTFKH